LLVEIVFYLFYLELGLQMHPVAGAIAEVYRQANGCIRSDAAFFVDDLIDASWRHFYGARQGILADLPWFKVLFQQDFSGVLAKHR
jgi:hypothetical protein